MAKSSAKKLFKKNVDTLRTHVISSLAVNLAYVIIRILMTGLTISNELMFIIVNLVSVLLYIYFRALSKPSYDGTGQLVDAGEELNGNNVTAYLFDIVYIGWFATLGSLISGYFWYIYIGIYPIIPINDSNSCICSV